LELKGEGEMKRKVLIALVTGLALLTMALTSSVAIAQPDPVVINPLGGPSEFTVPLGQPVELRWGWLAGSPGVVRAFLRAQLTEYRLDDTLIFDPPELADQYWGPVESTDPVPHCGPGAFVSRWVYPLEQELGLGDHELRTVFSLDHRLTDLCDGDEDGRPDLYYGLYADHTVVIHVADE